MCAGLFEVGRGQIDGELEWRKGKGGVFDGGTDTLTTFVDAATRETDKIERRETATSVAFGGNQMTTEAVGDS